jgi:hypothetical protein
LLTPSIEKLPFLTILSASFTYSSQSGYGAGVHIKITESRNSRAARKITIIQSINFLRYSGILKGVLLMADNEVRGAVELL